jgi:hypothetical protein
MPPVFVLEGMKMKLKPQILLLVFPLLTAVGLALAAESARAELPMGWTSVRALGMGNAYTAVADDADALMYNPAMLAKVKGVHWRVMNPRVGIDNPNNVQLAGKLTDQSTDVATKINSLYGSNIWTGGGGMSAVTVPYFGFGAYVNTEAGIKAQSPPYAHIDTNYYFDYGATLGFALPLIPEFVAIGVSTRSVNRTGTTGGIGPATLAQNDINALTNEFKRRGSAFAVDSGIIFTAPGPIAPTVSFVYRNMGYTTFSHQEGAGSPPSIAPEMIAGAAFKIDLPLITITPSIDYRYIGQNVATGNNLGLGVEVALPLIDLRAGMNQGYYTAGLGLDMGLIRADVATWAVELGAYPGQEADRRYMAQLTIQLGFDPSLFWGSSTSSSGTGTSGERRHLKQRR